jgi:hypothetical protein
MRSVVLKVKPGDHYFVVFNAWSESEFNPRSQISCGNKGMSSSWQARKPRYG